MNLLQKTKKKIVKIYIESEDLTLSAATMAPGLNDALIYLQEGYSLQVNWADEIQDLPFPLYVLFLRFLQVCAKRQVKVVFFSGQGLRDMFTTIDATELVHEWQS
ncbi:MAG: hypothetical protein AAF518_04660 [Spirochaetota bacterium]